MTSCWGGREGNTDMWGRTEFNFNICVTNLIVLWEEFVKQESRQKGSNLWNAFNNSRWRSSKKKTWNRGSQTKTVPLPPKELLQSSHSHNRASIIQYILPLSLWGAFTISPDGNKRRKIAFWIKMTFCFISPLFPLYNTSENGGTGWLFLLFELLMDWNEQKRHPRSPQKPHIAAGTCIIFRMKSTKANQWLWAECGNHSLNSLSSLRVRSALLPFLPQIIETVPQRQRAEARCDSLRVLPAPLFTVSLGSVYGTPSLVTCTLASACLRRACVASRRVQKEFSRTQGATLQSDTLCVLLPAGDASFSSADPLLSLWGFP